MIHMGLHFHGRPTASLLLLMIIVLFCGLSAEGSCPPYWCCLQIFSGARFPWCAGPRVLAQDRARATVVGLPGVDPLFLIVGGLFQSGPALDGHSGQGKGWRGVEGARCSGAGGGGTKMVVGERLWAAVCGWMVRTARSLWAYLSAPTPFMPTWCGFACSAQCSLNWGF